MAARRSFTPFVATLAVAALSVGGVLVGTAPVSAAPASTDACTTALEALEDEFGDVDFDDDFNGELSEEQQAELDALFAAYEEEVVPLYEQLGLDFSEVDVDAAYEVEEDALEELEAADTRRADAKVLLDAADERLRLAEAALLAAEAGGDPDATAAALAERDAAALARVPLFDAFTAAETTAKQLEEDLQAISIVVTAIEELDLAFWDALEEFFPELPELDVLRLLELLTDVALECSDVDDDHAGGRTDTGTAPVAKPVSARASFTG